MDQPKRKKKRGVLLVNGTTFRAMERYYSFIMLLCYATAFLPRYLVDLQAIMFRAFFEKAIKRYAAAGTAKCVGSLRPTAPSSACIELT
jgi:hypothetical protein